MADIDFPIATGFYVPRSNPFARQECTNWYVSPAQAPAFSEAALYGTPGIDRVLSTGDFTEANRGGHELGEVPFFVNGNSLYRIDRALIDDEESFSATSVGTVAGTGRVSMADNGAQLCVLIPGGPGYIYDESLDPQFQEITDPDFRANGNPQFVVYIDTFFLFTTDTDRFIISGVRDGLSYNALDFGSAEADPDAVVAPIVFRNQLYIFGGETVEVFRNQGGADFPFIRVNGFILPYGLFAPFSLIQASDTFMFVGGATNEQPTIRQFTGSGTQKISTDAVDNLLEAASPEEIEACFSWTYSQQGAVFVGFTFGDKTAVYDQTSQLWHIRSSRSKSSTETSFVEGRYRVSSMLNSYNRIIVSDLEDGRVGFLNLDAFQEYGLPIIRSFSTLPFSNQGDALFISYIELVMESGVGNSQSPDPKIWLQRSVDGGQTFSDPITRDIGKVGEYQRRIIWRRLGRASRFMLFKFTMSDAVKPIVLKLYANVAGAQGES